MPWTDYLTQDGRSDADTACVDVLDTFILMLIMMTEQTCWDNVDPKNDQMQHYTSFLAPAKAYDGTNLNVHERANLSGILINLQSLRCFPHLTKNEYRN